MAIIKVLDMTEHVTSMIKLKFIRNRPTLKITNNTNDMVTFDRKDMIRIFDIRSSGYYKVKQDVLQKHLGRHYDFELAEDVSWIFFSKNRTNKLLEDKLLPDFYHGFFWSEENVHLNYFLTHIGVTV